MAERRNVTVRNISRQLIALQVKPPKGDFYAEERQVRLKPGQDIILPVSHLNQAQVENLRAKRIITVA